MAAVGLAEQPEPQDTQSREDRHSKELMLIEVIDQCQHRNGRNQSAQELHTGGIEPISDRRDDHQDTKRHGETSGKHNVFPTPAPEQQPHQTEHEAPRRDPQNGRKGRQQGALELNSPAGWWR